MCKSICEAILAVILIVVALWQIIAKQVVLSAWLVLIVGLLLLWHSFTCKKCFVSRMPMKEAKKKK